MAGNDVGFPWSNPNPNLSRLVLETAAAATSTGLLVLASLRLNVRPGVGVGHARGASKVRERFTGRAGALHQDGVLSGRGQQGQLIEGEDLTAPLEDALAGLLRDTQGTHVHLGHVQLTVIVGHGSDHDGNRLIVLAAQLQQLRHSRQSNRRLVGSAHKQTAQDDLIELLVRPAVQEAVELNQQPQVHVQRFRLGTANLAVPLVIDIDTLKRETSVG